MKALLAFLVTLSVFANGDHFVMEKETTMKRLQAANTDAAVVACVQNANTMEEMAACEKAPETKPVDEKVQAKAPETKQTDKKVQAKAKASH
ncbi:MAG: hypothetical protein ACHQYQ_00555 [Bacteriovoracales bacterium]